MFRLSTRAKKPREVELANQKITIERERPLLSDLRKTRAKLVWRRAGNVVEVRLTSTGSLQDGDTAELVFNRNEVLLMASRLLGDMDDVELAALIKKVGSPAID